jgi:hypothetical protein
MNDIQNIITERVDDIPLLLEQMQRIASRSLGTSTIIQIHFLTALIL